MVKPIDIDLQADRFAEALKQMKERMNLGGTKHDSGKTDLSLVPLILIEATAQALQFGESKYGRYNFTKGFENHRLIAACLRHVLAYQDGEDLDPESNLPHLGHAVACLGMLLECKKLGTLTDTRLKGVKV